MKLDGADLRGADIEGLDLLVLASFYRVQIDGNQQLLAS